MDRLNDEFAGDSRRIVFWYDDNGYFVEEIEELQLDNAKILILDGHNQFATKLIIEREDVSSNYRIYAPYPEPALVNNHLALPNALQVCLDSGAKKILLPITSAADIGSVPAELIGCFNLIFYSSAEDAVFKALGVE